jgi:hypothetical protein
MSRLPDRLPSPVEIPMRLSKIMGQPQIVIARRSVPNNMLTRQLYLMRVQSMKPDLYFSFKRQRRKVPARYANSASLATTFEQIVSLMSEDGHVDADGMQFLINLARQTQKITKPMSAAQMIDHSLLDEVLAGK